MNVNRKIINVAFKIEKTSVNSQNFDRTLLKAITAHLRCFHCTLVENPCVRFLHSKKK